MWEADSVSEIKRDQKVHAGDPCEMFPTPPRGCEVSAVGRGGNRQPVSQGGRPVTCWGLGSARRGGGGGWERSPGRSGTVRGRERGRGRRTETREARRWNALFSRRGDFAREWRIVWGGVSHRLLPRPGSPSRRFLRAFRPALGSLKSRGGSCCRQGQWKSRKAGNVSRASLTLRTAGTGGVSNRLIRRWSDGYARPPPLAAFYKWRQGSGQRKGVISRGGAFSELNGEL